MNNLRTTPEGAKEIQTGLWLHEYEKNIVGNTYNRRELYSSDGYCFYDKTDKHLDENGEIIPDHEVPPTRRKYMQYASLGLNTDVNDFISVPVDPNYEIV